MLILFYSALLPSINELNYSIPKASAAYHKGSDDGIVLEFSKPREPPPSKMRRQAEKW